MGTIPQKNSFVTSAEQMSLYNVNVTEMLTKLNDIVTSSNSVINVKQTDSEGNETTYQFPSVSKLQADIAELNNNIKILAGLNDNEVHIINGKSSKKIFLADLNKEPNKIDTLNEVNKFTQTNNWFFESLMSPTLAINFNLTDKIGADVDGIISRRYIVKFEKNTDGTYTDKGEAARQDFVNKYVGKKNIKLSDFISWYTTATKTGIINNLTPTYDEQFFNFEYQEVIGSGVFSVIKQNTDTNNKLWYNINPNSYVGSNGNSIQLKKDDELILNKENAVSRWKIIETSVSAGYRIRLERIEGYDAIPTGDNVLKYYGSTVINKEVKVTVGFDEYLVIFMKPTNSRNKIKGKIWSTGTGLYTNDLKLDLDDTVSMGQYYLENVYDYGTLLKDMIKKHIPSIYGIKPNAPVLVSENFKVVQINKQVTSSTDTDAINTLLSQKENIKSKINLLNKSIVSINEKLNNNVYSSEAERNSDKGIKKNYIDDINTYTTSLNTTISQIIDLTNNINDTEKKYRIRGFWVIPNAQSHAGTKTQEVIKFRILYKYLSKNGSSNATESYKYDSTTTAYYSEWNEILTDVRKRNYSEATQEWIWVTEDVSNASIININQLEIPISPGEKVEMKIYSISEVGYPDTILESDASNTLIIEFPDNLEVKNNNSSILENAKLDIIKNEFEQTLNTKGLNKHVENSYYGNEKYIAHIDENIQTNYKDSNNNTLNLREYIDLLTSRIITLENIINSAKGILKVMFINGTSETEIKNGSETEVNIVLQNYADFISVSRNGATYKNNILTVRDCSLKIKNLSNTSPLKFLVKDTYTAESTVRHLSYVNNLASLVSTDGKIIIQEDNQFIYFCDTLKGTDVAIYDGAVKNTINDDNEVYTTNAIESYDKNIGLSSDPVTGFYNSTLSNEYRQITENWYVGNDLMGTTVAPQVVTIDDLKMSNALDPGIKINDEITIPINIYGVFKTSSSTEQVNLHTLSYSVHNKYLRVRMHPSIDSVPFDFTIKFKIENKRNN